MTAAAASSPASSPGFTRSVEDYLKAIYQLAPEGGPVATSEIAQRLELSAPSVSAMVKRLGEQRFLEHVPYRGVRLTAEGRRVALRMVRRHRIIEAYLVATLAYTWDTVHEEAERLEHAVSDTLIERMAAALGHPGFDPHGDPIPTAEGTLPAQECVPLSEVAAGSVVRLARVTERDSERLRYLASFGLTPGAEVAVVAHQPFEGPITFRVGASGEEHVLAHALGRALLCEVTR
ncbi:MAG TPA: metal-dependent transcriptional regulator [Gemmatimonadales bacterium]|nr:metal-dependent transcriptional regulator [Gemmatimonadales bacterium]